MLAALMLALASGVDALADAHVTWLTDSHDFGAFSEDLGTVEAKFRLVNDGNEPVTIVSARANCGCTVPKFTEGSIAPGDTAEVSVSYIASQRPGRFSKKVFVNTSDDPKHQTVLTISGTVVGASQTIRSRFPIDAGPLQLRDTVASFNDVLRGKVKTVFIQGYNLTERPLYPVVTDLPDYLGVSISPSEVPPGEQVAIAFTLNSDRLPQWGINTARFTLIPDEGADPVSLSMFAIAQEDFSKLTPGERVNAPVIKIEPAKVDLGFISRRGTHTVKYTITNTGNLPLIIRRVQAIDPVITDVKISSDKIKKGKSATLTLTVDPELARAEIINARVTITANDPSNPLSVVRVTAEIQ